MSEIQVMLYSDWIDKGRKLFGDNMIHWKFKCCNCGHVQTYQDFKDIGVAEPSKYIGFSCIGRFMPKATGTIGNKKKPCNYTIGGLFNLAKLKVVEPNGKEHFHFEFEEANHHEN